MVATDLTNETSCKASEKVRTKRIGQNWRSSMNSTGGSIVASTVVTVVVLGAEPVDVGSGVGVDVAVGDGSGDGVSSAWDGEEKMTAPSAAQRRIEMRRWVVIVHITPA